MADHCIKQDHRDFYIYTVSVDGIVRYIGKGRGSRLREHLGVAKRLIRLRADGATVKTSRFYNRLAKAVKSGAEIVSEPIISGLDEESAFKLEIEQIASAPDGQLWNTFSGGNGFSSEWMKSQWDSPNYRAKQSSRSRAMWNDPAYRANQIAIRNSPQHRAYMSTVLRDALADPSVRKRMSDKKKQFLSVPKNAVRFHEAGKLARSTVEWKRKQSEAKRKQWADPDTREALIASFKKGRADPKKRAEMSVRTSAQMTPEHRKLLSEINKAKWQDPEFRASQLSPERIQRRREALKLAWVKRKAKASLALSGRD